MTSSVNTFLDLLEELISSDTSDKIINEMNNNIDKSMNNSKRNICFVLMGQSNMAGRGVVEKEDTIPHSQVQMWKNNKVC